ncbi:hypothetical protein SAMN04489716_4477 [Actinoplanes derwentensis]|uniref:Uncharacterized protein n=1 Tax=Actinoplanes derwentensis TaxID=113562 RepID=A0A1H2BAX8_9ACTN|nr:hypothetical protein SAMN04489716_4477 [Actinoplanes derwentensis]
MGANEAAPTRIVTTSTGDGRPNRPAPGGAVGNDFGT